jgi:hypothetical protein
MSADLRALALGRIALALVLLADLARRAAGIDDWYTNAGLLPNHTLLWRPTFEWVFSPFLSASHRGEALAGFGLCALAYLALLFGVRTRLAQIASLIAVLSLHGRTLFVQNGGDVALSLLALWTAFLPTGKRYSVDALALYLRERKRTRDGALSTERTTRRSCTSLAVFAVVLQLAAIYALTALQKNGETWREGSVVHYMLHQDCVVTALGTWLRGWLEPWHSRALTFAVRVGEGTLPFLLLSPFAQRDTRLLAIGLIVVLHVGLGLLLSLGVFGLAMCAFTPNLLAKRDLDALEVGAGRLAERYGLRFERWLARPTLLRLVRRFGAPAPDRPDRPRGAAPRASARLRELVVGYLLVCAVVQALVENPGAISVPRELQPQLLRATSEYLQAKQGWSMYAPDAPTTDMNLFVDAITSEGRRVDPWNESASPSHSRPGPKIPPHLGSNSMHYAYVLRIPRREAYFSAFSAWILRYPERTGRPADALEAFEVFLVEDDSPPPGERESRNPRQTSLFKYP